ncbi:hypothetical protein E2C01_044875 [Portunus trituberculatus]|uniref:Secreted protein n=1 Tax=Portunus trituberculatus TaxID=210409 RepID=A0A5B7G1N3_PORTR|nr:hypothetical protein [Portunus trituberculatus]
MLCQCLLRGAVVVVWCGVVCLTVKQHHTSIEFRTVRHDGPNNVSQKRCTDDTSVKTEQTDRANRHSGFGDMATWI